MSSSATPSRHIVLMGLMGSGKTTVGEAVAHLLGCPFSDSDRYLEARFSMSGRQIVEESGVSALHAYEIEHLLEALASPVPSVIAAAASVVDRAECVQAIAERSIGIWLDVEPQVLVSRLRPPDHRRPLADGLGSLTEQRRQREGPYREAAALVMVEDSTDGTPDSMVAGLVDAIVAMRKNAPGARGRGPHLPE